MALSYLVPCIREKNLVFKDPRNAVMTLALIARGSLC